MMELLASGQTTGYKRFGRARDFLTMRIVRILLLSGLAACSATPSVSEGDFLGQSGWRHRQAIEDVDIIMQ